MSSNGKYNWAECTECFGRGKRWLQGSTNAASRCEACRGIGRVCTQNAGPVFDQIGQQVPGRVQNTHPLGDCMECCGIITEVYGSLLKATSTSLDLADKIRSQQREFHEQTVETGLSFEKRMQAMEGRFLAAVQDIPKQLAAASQEAPREQPQEQPQETPGFFKRVFGKKEEKETTLGNNRGEEP